MPETANPDRVRAHTDPDTNRSIDEETARRVARYAQSSPSEITPRIEELDREWDIERVLETNASALALTGLDLMTRPALLDQARDEFRKLSRA